MLTPDFITDKKHTPNHLINYKKGLIDHISWKTLTLSLYFIIYNDKELYFYLIFMSSVT